MTIPNLAGGGGSGWYRIATAGILGSNIIAANFTVTADINGLGGQVLQLSVTAPVGSPSYTTIVQTDNKFSGVVPIDTVRASNDGTSAIALDIHLDSTADTNPIVLSLLGVGLLTPVTTFPVGATALTNSVSVATTTAGSTYLQLPIVSPSTITSTKTGGGSASGFVSQAANPSYSWGASGQGTDAKWWDAIVAGTALLFRTSDDAQSANTTWMQVDRSGYAVTDVTLPTPVDMTGITGHGSKRPVCVDTAGALYVGNNTGTGAPCP